MKISLKYRVSILAVCLSLFFTFLAGVSAQVRWVTLLQRSAAAMVLFGAVGYVLGMWLESHIRTMIDPPEVGQHLDVVNEHLVEEDVEGFDPFTAESFERIHRK